MTNTQRIAICISGQVRTSSEKLSEIASRAREIDADVFISIWRNRGGKTLESGPGHLSTLRFFGVQISMFLPRTWCRNMTAVIPEWHDLIPERTNLTEQELREIFPDAEIEIESDRDDLDFPPEKNSLRMLYKIARCNQLKRDREIAKGFRYDRVIRVRPDMLVDFQAMALRALAPKNALVSLRAGQSIHDKYWAADSDTDDLLSNLFNYSTKYRLNDWRGIHEELTDYININKIIPIGTTDTVKDFKEFGDYTDQDRQVILKKFQNYLETAASSEDQGSPGHYALIARDVLVNACDFVLGKTQKPLAPTVLSNLEKFFNSHTRWERPEELLPIITLSYAYDSNLSVFDKIKLLAHLFLGDALTWPQWLGHRIRGTFQLLPDLCAELVPMICNIDQPRITHSENSEVRRILKLWDQVIDGFDPEQQVAARKTVAQTFLGDLSVREQLSKHFLKNGQYDQLVALATYVQEFFPDRDNSATFLNFAYAQKRMASSDFGQ